MHNQLNNIHFMLLCPRTMKNRRCLRYPVENHLFVSPFNIIRAAYFKRRNRHSKEQITSERRNINNRSYYIFSALVHAAALNGGCLCLANKSSVFKGKDKLFVYTKYEEIDALVAFILIFFDSNNL